MALLCLVLASSRVAAADAGQPNIGLTEAEVLAAVIDHGRSADHSLLVIADETTADPAALTANDETLALLARDLALPAGLVTDWARRNAERSPLDRPLALTVSYRAVSRKTLDELFDGVDPAAGWERFYAHFAGAPGLLRVSRVGFDEFALSALVYVELQCGADCGSARLVHLDRAAGSWQVKDAVLVWMTD